MGTPLCGKSTRWEVGLLRTTENRQTFCANSGYLLNVNRCSSSVAVLSSAVPARKRNQFKGPEHALRLLRVCCSPVHGSRVCSSQRPSRIANQQYARRFADEGGCVGYLTERHEFHVHLRR